MTVQILTGDCRALLATLPAKSVQCVVTSPPYFGLRSYLPNGHEHKTAEMGSEPTLAEYISGMVEVFREVRRVLRDDGTVWLNIGDSYNAGTSASRKKSTNVQHGYWENGGTMGDRRVTDKGTKPKDLMLVPARLAIALVEDGWYLRSDIIWNKPNPMPESVTDRPTSAHEHIFLLTKQPRYFYDADAIREDYNGRHGGGSSVREINRGGRTDGYTKAPDLWEPPNGSAGRNARNVWTITPKPFANSHFATFPPELPERCIKAGTSERGQCPDCGAPWVRVVERTPVVDPGRSEDAKRFQAAGVINRGQGERRLGAQYQEMLNANPPRTTGWHPSCSCDAGDPVPQVVLDPFLGSGTTLLVADRLNRNGIGIELSPAYALMAKNRIYSDAPLFVEITA